MGEARAAVTADSDRVRVTVWTFEGAGDATGPHRHEFDYVVVPVTGGTFTVRSPDGAEREMAQVAGEPYLGGAGAEHDVISATDGKAVFVEIEYKR